MAVLFDTPARVRPIPKALVVALLGLLMWSAPVIAQEDARGFTVETGISTPAERSAKSSSSASSSVLIAPEDGGRHASSASVFENDQIYGDENMVDVEAPSTPIDAAALRRQLLAGEAERVLAVVESALDESWARLDSTTIYALASVGRDAGERLHRTDESVHFARLAQYYSGERPERRVEAFVRLAEIKMRIGEYETAGEHIAQAQRVLWEEEDVTPQMRARVAVAEARWHAERLLWSLPSKKEQPLGQSALERAERRLAESTASDIPWDAADGRPSSASLRVDLWLSAAMIRQAEGEWKRSQVELQKAHDLARRVYDVWWRFRVEMVAAAMDRQRGDWRRALARNQALLADPRLPSGYRAEVLKQVVEIAAVLQQPDRSEEALSKLLAMGAHREHRQALQAAAEYTAATSGTPQNWGTVGLLVLIITMGITATSQWWRRRTSRTPIHIRRTSRTSTSFAPARTDPGTEWTPIHPKRLLDAIEEHRLPVYSAKGRRVSERSSASPNPPGQWLMQLDRPRTLEVAIDIDHLNNEQPSYPDAPAGEKLDLEHKDANGIRRDGIRVNCVTETGGKSEPLWLPSLFGKEVATNRLVGLSLEGITILFYQLQKATDETIQRDENGIRFTSHQRIIGIPVALLQDEPGIDN